MAKTKKYAIRSGLAIKFAMMYGESTATSLQLHSEWLKLKKNYIIRIGVGIKFAKVWEHLKSKLSFLVISAIE